MPTKRRKGGFGLTMLAGLTVGYVSSAYSQTSVQTSAPLNHVQATLDIQALATSNAELAKGGNAPGKKELVLSATPGLGFQLKGSQAELNGRLQLVGLRYVRATQPDRILPNGQAKLKMDAVKDAVGVQATLNAEQVRASTTAQQIGLSNTANSYTDVTLHLAPYLRGQIDANTMVEALLDRGVVNSTQYTPPTSLNNSNQRDAFTSDDRIRVLRKPVPLGYEVQVLEKSDRYKGTSTPALQQQEGSVAMLLAPNPDITVGLKLLRARDTLQGHDFDNTAFGYQAQWRPTERSLFQAETENRSYGRTWSANLQHRWPWVSASIKAERLATSYARQAGISQLQIAAPRPGDPTPTPSTGSAIEPTQPFDSGAQIRQAIQGRLNVMGRRNQLNFAAGLVKSASLVAVNGNELTTGGSKSREYYFETQLDHQLTPANSIIGGLRWGRVWAVQPLTGENVLSRDFVIRAAYNTKLTPDTTATMGLKRQISHNSPVAGANETSGYVGLGHRF